MSLSQVQRRMGAVMLALAAAMASPSALAWPDRPVRIVVGFAPGGAADIAARIVAESLQRKYGQPVTVENKAGAGGRLATDAVAKADGDGYTLGLMVGGDTVVAASDPKLPYQLLRDFQYVSTLSAYPFVIVAGPTSPAQSVSEMMAMSRKTPGALRYATPGRGTTQHLAGELMAALGQVEMSDVPYRGSSAAMVDVITGRVDFTIAALSTVRGDLQAGKLKAVAVTSRERIAALPAVPSVAEALANYEVTTWMGITAPARTPADVIDKLNKDLREVLSQSGVRDRLVGLGLEPLPSSPAEMRARVEGDLNRWRSLMQVRKIDLTQ